MTHSIVLRIHDSFTIKIVRTGARHGRNGQGHVWHGAAAAAAPAPVGRQLAEGGSRRCCRRSGGRRGRQRREQGRGSFTAGHGRKFGGKAALYC